MGASTIGGSAAGFQLVRSAASVMMEMDGSSIAGASVAGAFGEAEEDESIKV